MSRIGRRATSFNDLPHELAFDIFFRVPVKSLIRSSAVCKTWYSIVKNPDFVSAEISHAISSCNEDSVLIIPRHDKYCLLISAETGAVIDKYEIPFASTKLELVGSVNGLVCLIDDFIPTRDPFLYTFPKTAYHNLYMWNPSVRKYKQIVSSSFRKRYADEVRISYAHGFGFYEPSRDYRVVRIMYFNGLRGNQFEKLTPRVEVFSLRMNRWRPWRGDNNAVVSRVASKIGTTVNSTVYWLKDESSGVWIMSFDFNNEVFGKIKLPNDVCHSLGEVRDFQLMKFEGSLSVCVRNHLTLIDKKFYRPCCIWLISHNDGVVSSTLRFRVVLKKIGQPLNITKGGALLMAKSIRSTCKVLSCNLQSMQYTYLEFHEHPCNAETFFVESLGGAELLTSSAM
ncbi:F-box/kelch-repeat protein At3g23880-like [Apium graveolens]|uniref:F-box/kelch-repeat protein At3g23880-like n=1 Tax=Apium graveolens TaxID=4045 RepID=UPI003D79D766